MEPKSTVQNSKNWRLWHNINYIIGGITFFLGSIVLFPSFTMFLQVASVSAWLYTIGSFTFLLADITQWLHFQHYYSLMSELSFNFFTSVIGSTLYLVGSALYIPSLNLASTGGLLFIIGSSIIVISQTWKLFRMINDKTKTISQSIQEDQSGFYVDFLAGAGGLMYLIGTIFFKQIQALKLSNHMFQIIAITVYSLGGTFFLGSGLFMVKRYFMEIQQVKHQVMTNKDQSQFNISALDMQKSSEI